MKDLKKIILAALLGTLITVPAAYANNVDGDEGTTSSGTADITVDIPKLVKITKIDGLDGGTFDGQAGFDENEDVCIYSNMDTSSETYSVTINNTNPSAANSAGFYVGNAANNQEIAYTIHWNDVTGTAGESAAMTENSALGSQDGFSNSLTCGGGNNANYHVTMTAAAMSAVKPGTYSSTITILITPE